MKKIRKNKETGVHKFVDLTGLKFGTKTVISYAGKNKNKFTIWNLQCDCGEKSVTHTTEVKASRRCKKCHPCQKDYTGERFGSRVVIGFSGRAKHGNSLWKVRCDCGHEDVILAQSFKLCDNCQYCSPKLKASRPNRRKRPYEALYNGWKNRLDKLKNHLVFITYEDFLTFTSTHVCHCCGEDIYWSKYRQKGEHHSSATNLDRKDNDLPYTMDNIVVCCARCNKAKNTHFTYDEWRKLGSVIRTWQKTKQ